MSKDIYTDEEKQMMLKLVRKTIESALKEETTATPQDLSKKFNEILSCFITLHSAEGNLRGCIGNIGANEPLIYNIVHNAYNAAFKDPRFPALDSLEELETLHIEISILTAPEPVRNLDSFVIGKHGIILFKNGRSSVFLPQVATEQGWDVDTTLTHLSLKAGLGANAWREDDAKFHIFEAIIFSE